MIKRILRICKRALVSTGTDAFVATAFHRSRIRLLQKLIPAPSFYSPGQTKQVTRFGVKYKLRPSDLSQWFMFADINSQHVKAALEAVKSGNGVILDVGANIGHFSLQLAKHITRNKWDKQIIAFEPNPRIWQEITTNLSLNPSLKNVVTLNNFGLGDEDTKVEMQIPHRNSGAGTIMQSYSHEPHDRFVVPIKKLDDVIGDSSVDFIKIDVEEYEYFVLKGARQTIEKYHPVIYFETFESQPHQVEIFDMLKSFGYRFSIEMQDGFLPIEATREDLASMKDITNILAVAN